MEKTKKILLKNTIMLYLLQISSYIFPLLSFPYLTRVLGVEKYGIIVFINSIMSYFSLIIDFGFLLSGTKTCSAFSEDKKKLGQITIGIIQAKFSLLLISLIALFFCCIFVQQLKDNFLFTLFSFVGVGLSIFLPDYLFRGIEKMDVITYRVLLSKVVYIIFIFVFVHESSDYIKVPLASIISNIVAVFFTWIEIYKRKIIIFSFVSFKETFLYLKESFLFFLSRIATTFYTSLNTIILGLNFSDIDLGNFGVANTLSNTCRSFMSPIADSIYPYMIKQKKFDFIKKIFIIIEPIIILLCILLWFIADFVIKISCGDGYENAVSLLQYMIPIIAITFPAYICGYPVLGALGKIKWANISVVFSAAFHILGLLFLFITNQIDFKQVIVLTFFTELVELCIRGFVIFITLWRKNV